MLKRKKVKPITLRDVTIIDDGKLRKAITAASLGNAMEWFDFGVYGFVAYALGKVFFPGADPSVQMVAALATFSVPFLIRPLGGLFFGMLGDKYGRQKILAITIVIMSISTFCIGLIPSYDTIGIWAPILLLICKMAQGFSVGGEYTGASIFVAEYSPDRKRGFMGSWLDFGSIAGFVLGAGVVVLISTIVGEANFLDWGWRIPFSHNLHYSEDHGVLIIIAIMIGMLFVQPVMGLLSDRFGRRPFVLLGSVALFVLAIPAFILINSNVIGLIFAGLLMLAVILNCFTGVMASTLPAMFPTHIRYSALAAAFNISVLVAGLTPTLAAWLVESSQNLMMPAYYLMVVAVIGLITGVTMKETANRPLKGATPAASDIQEAKEILVEHYDNIEQKIDNIDHEIADLQAKRTRLVQQHPRIDE